MYLIFGIVIIMALVTVQGIRQNKASLDKQKALTRKEYGQKPLSVYPRTTETCLSAFRHRTKTFFIDDITWNDLDMDRVFKRINYTLTSAGTEELYCMIREPLTQEEETKKRIDLIHRMEQDEESLFMVRDLLQKVGFTGKYALEDYMDLLEGVKNLSIPFLILTDLLYIPAVIFIILKPLPGLLLLLGLVLFHITLYFKEKAKLNPYLISFSYILRLLRFGKQLSDGLKGDTLASEKTKIQELVSKFDGFYRFSGIAMSMRDPVGSSNPLDLIMDYIRMLFHFDLMKFHQMLQTLRTSSEDILLLNRSIGMLDAISSVCYYRKSLSGYCEPEFSKDGREAKGIYHPLLENPVANDLDLKKDILLTGSNASGKSTYLKTAALNVIFAQSIMTCLSETYCMPYVRVITSMSLRDDITSGKSYYMQEIEAILRILKAADETNTPVFCCVDEVLRGTNTVERIAASTQILRSLADKKVICIAATHDIELTSILEGQYQNFHFEETYDNENIRFSYELKEGRSTSRNAIRLLTALGYDGELTKEAEKMAERFLSSGTWDPVVG